MSLDTAGSFLWANDSKYAFCGRAIMESCLVTSIMVFISASSSVDIFSKLDCHWSPVLDVVAIGCFVVAACFVSFDSDIMLPAGTELRCESPEMEAGTPVPPPDVPLM